MPSEPDNLESHTEECDPDRKVDELRFSLDIRYSELRHKHSDFVDSTDFREQFHKLVFGLRSLI